MCLQPPTWQKQDFYKCTSSTLNCYSSKSNMSQIIEHIQVWCVCSVVAQLLCTSCECTSKESFVQTDEHRILFQKAKPDLDLCLLLWSDRVKLSIFKEIIDVVVVNLNVGHKNTVTAVLIHMIAFTRLLWMDHICKLWIGLLPVILDDRLSLKSTQNIFGIHFFKLYKQQRTK